MACVRLLPHVPLLQLRLPHAILVQRHQGPLPYVFSLCFCNIQCHRFCTCFCRSVPTIVLTWPALVICTAVYHAAALFSSHPIPKHHSIPIPPDKGYESLPVLAVPIPPGDGYESLPVLAVPIPPDDSYESLPVIAAGHQPYSQPHLSYGPMSEVQPRGEGLCVPAH
eukprot:1158259-Pelagomonas_calceolata.AAC.2